MDVDIFVITSVTMVGLYVFRLKLHTCGQKYNKIDITFLKLENWTLHYSKIYLNLQIHIPVAASDAKKAAAVCGWL